jgi:hypothetical protein
MLHQFLTSNRTILIDRCRVMVGSRSGTKLTEQELLHGIPAFLDQLIETLKVEQSSKALDNPLKVRTARVEVASDVGTTAALHGHDLFVKGFTIEQVVRDYGDVCQAVTNLALESGAPISVGEFRTFNRCLDSAIAGAVTEYVKHTPASNEASFQILSLGHDEQIAQLRAHLDTAMLAMKAISTGTVSVVGATAAVLSQNLTAMRNIIGQ